MQHELSWGTPLDEGRAASTSPSTTATPATDASRLLSGDVIFASVEEQEQRTIELLGEGALVITLPPPTIDVRGRLGEVLEELVERELARVGVPSPYLAAWSAMPEDAQARLADQVFRAHGSGATGLAIACGSLRRIAIPTLTPDDSAVLRWLAEATDELPLILLIDDSDLRVLGHRAPVPLATLLARPPRVITTPPPSIDPDLVEQVHAHTDAEHVEHVEHMDHMEHVERVEHVELAGDDATHNDTQVAPIVIAAPDIISVAPAAPPPAPAPTPAPAPEPVPSIDLQEAVLSLDIDLDRMDENDEVPTVEAIAREMTPVPVVAAAAREEKADAIKPVPVVMIEAPAAAKELEEEEPKAAEPAKVEVKAEERATVEEPAKKIEEPTTKEAKVEEPAAATTATTATTATPTTTTTKSRRSASASRRVSAGVPVVGPNDGWRTWAIALSTAKGAQSLATFERLFAESYVPLANAIARGLDDPRAVRAYDDFRRTFERSYTDAFATFGATNRRPKLVMDAYDLAAKQARLSNARSAQIIVVDSMRLDLGCLIRDAICREMSGTATLTTETLLWSALPTTTMRQLETFARGLDALRAPAREEPSESLRGRAAEVVRRLRVGSRELYKLDLIPAMLEGRDTLSAFPEIAAHAAESLARHFSTLHPRTLVLLLGDHGFNIDRRGEIQTGGASPEEVLVPAFGFLIGELH